MGKRTDWGIRSDELIVEMYGKGDDPKTIGDKLCVHRTTVMRHIRRMISYGEWPYKDKPKQRKARTMKTKKPKGYQPEVYPEHDKQKWCSSWLCPIKACLHNPDNIPPKYKNTAERYDYWFNFKDCTRGDEKAARPWQK